MNISVTLSYLSTLYSLADESAHGMFQRRHSQVNWQTSIHPRVEVMKEVCVEHFCRFKNIFLPWFKGSWVKMKDYCLVNTLPNQTDVLTKEMVAEQIVLLLHSKIPSSNLTLTVSLKIVNERAAHQTMGQNYLHSLNNFNGL